MKNDTETKKTQTLINEENQDQFPVKNSINSVFVLEITYGHILRTIALTGEFTLHDLHNTIQDVYKWDNDHLYAFYMNNRIRGEKNVYYSPNDYAGPFANEKLIYTLGLIPNKRFLYLFDFGDQHRFRVIVKQIVSQEEIPGPYPVLLHQKGKAPKQYPEWE